MTVTPTVRLLPGRTLRLGGGEGELRVLEGRVWLTLDGVDADHFIGPGVRLRLGAGNGAVVEPAGRHQHATVAWRPRAGWLARFGAQGLRAAAALSARAAKVFTGLARLAATRADLLHRA